ncbi:MAG: T9SS type A sorting domain-containing protein [Saprospiraceae bacterium]|nr:T9SS type A sorting domain-containing protein [Saprospiraceae bacterium]
MKPIRFAAALLLLLACSYADAQTGCPGCTVNLPTLPDDTLYLAPMPDGVIGQPYDADLSFRVPKTTTPVHAVDSTTPPGLPISKIEVTGVEGLPAGMFWEANQLVFETATQTDGCVKFCGTPYESDSFIIIVKLKATVLFLTQETSFPLRLYIAPPVSTNDGFSMNNFTGCGPTTVTFTNNIPSNGNPGFTYDWDFGDSTTFTGENPPPHTYTAQGIYPVNYHAVIDTVGYILTSVTVYDVDCTDPVNAPDLFVRIKDGDNVEVYNSSPAINNTSLPHTFQLNFQLEPGINYLLEVSDDDEGIKGADDVCGIVPFNIFSNDTFNVGGLTVALNIIHPVTEVFSADTVLIFDFPVPPVINAPQGLTVCEGDEPLVLVSSYGAGNQWILDSIYIAGANDFLFQPTQSGLYQVLYATPYGCTSISDGVPVFVYPLPAEPVFTNTNNLLEMADTTQLAAGNTVQWLLNNEPIEGATGPEYCATESGTYSLLATDPSTGCTAVFNTLVTFDPAFDCTVGSKEPVWGSVGIYPNPTTGQTTLQLDEAPQNDARLRVWDAQGKLVAEQPWPAGTDRFELNGSTWPGGLYLLELINGQKILMGRLVKQ